MLNQIESIQTVLNYRKKQNWNFFKIFLAFFPGSALIKIIRAQIAEINLLQLFPGFYLCLIVFLLLYLLFVDYLWRLCFRFDSRTGLGMKLIRKVHFFIIFKHIMFLLSIENFLTTTQFIPLSLDSLNFYGEKNLENFLSLKEILNFEILMIFFFSLFSFFPIFLVKIFLLEKNLRNVSKYWKNIFLLSFLIGGVLTPTIDILTQSLLAFFSINLYLFFFFLLKKKINYKNIRYYSLY